MLQQTRVWDISIQRLNLPNCTKAQLSLHQVFQAPYLQVQPNIY